jgi:hypothetical protein
MRSQDGEHEDDYEYWNGIKMEIFVVSLFAVE